MPHVSRIAGHYYRNQVEEALSAAIVTGEMEPGRVFSAPALAETFGVSATPVREAMMSLEKRGFVETIRNKGFRVTHVSKRDLEQLVAVRMLLEPPAMRQLAPTASRELVERFRPVAARIVRGATAGPLDDYVAADNDFHLGLLEALGNDRLVQTVAELRGQTRLPGIASLVGTPELIASAREHERLLDHLESRDAEGAEQLMHRHLHHILGLWSGEPDD